MTEESKDRPFEAEQTVDQLIAKLAADVAARTEQCRMLDDAVTIPKALYDEWVAANDAALDWADANARWFDISTAPRDGTLIELLVVDSDFPLDDDDENGTVTLGYWADASERSDEPAWDFAGWNHSHDCWTAGNGTPTHWRPIQNPPLGQLPEPLERLGEVLRKVKGA